MTIDERLLELRQTEQRISDMTRAIATGGGGGGHVDDGWKKNVEDQLKRNADDLRALLRGVVAAGLVIMGMIVGLYVYVGTKADALGSQLQAVRVEQEQARGELKLIDATVAGRLDRLNYRLSKPGRDR